ncbi:hypothetical protein CYMTET_41965 [Cymbomonas tetramitiformis]|uniref:Ricin B lectin domain-containing protein n=1 Tax=Cymbomonas tetramitiformis TaxID=36881 RepID=A0AAE0F1G2_9CHLO|nr:hypothetical protein CYMTET_41965 [Cymbomonas tetramitiformis]
MWPSAVLLTVLAALLASAAESGIPAPTPRIWAHCCVRKYDAMYPNCENLGDGFYDINVQDAMTNCLDTPGCNGFSFSAHAQNGYGWYKQSCYPDDSNNGYDYSGSHGYYECIKFPLRSKFGFCLETEGDGRAATKVHMSSCDSSKLEQKWQYDGTMISSAKFPGMCLDAAERNSDGGLVHLWNCDPSIRNQHWRITDSGGDHVEIKATHGKCLDVSHNTRNTEGGLVHMWSCGGQTNDNQKWVQEYETDAAEKRAQLVAFYQKYKPEQVEQVDAIMEAYTVQAIKQTCMARYNADPFQKRPIIAW